MRILRPDQETGAFTATVFRYVAASSQVERAGDRKPVCMTDVVTLSAGNTG